MSNNDDLFRVAANARPNESDADTRARPVPVGVDDSRREFASRLSVDLLTRSVDALEKAVHDRKTRIPARRPTVPRVVSKESDDLRRQIAQVVNQWNPPPVVGPQALPKRSGTLASCPTAAPMQTPGAGLIPHRPSESPQDGSLDDSDYGSTVETRAVPETALDNSQTPEGREASGRREGREAPPLDLDSLVRLLVEPRSSREDAAVLELTDIVDHTEPNGDDVDVLELTDIVADDRKAVAPKNEDQYQLDFGGTDCDLEVPDADDTYVLE